MELLILVALAAASPECPRMEGVWMQGSGERVMVMEQEGCLLRGSVAEPSNQVLHVRGFWTGTLWTMAATRLGACATTAWGTIRAEGADRMIVNVRGTDGLCGENGTPGPGPRQLDATIVYRRVNSTL
jgi:hypothetical protein